MGEWSLKPEKVGTMGPGVGSGVGEANGGSEKWEGTPALTQSILQAIFNVSPLSPLAQGVTGIPFRRLRVHVPGCKRYKDKPKTFQNTGRHLELLDWSEWDPPPGGSCPCLCHLSWAILTNSALSYLGSSSLPWTRGILTASIPPKGMWSSLETDRQEKKRGNKYLCGKKVIEDKHTANIRLKGDLPCRVQKERALGTEDLGSSCCRINFYIDPWSMSALMERVPSTKPKVHFLRLDQNYTQEGSQFGVTVSESCSFALQAGSQTLRHGRFAAEKGFIFKSFKQGNENKPQIHLAKGQGFVTYMG